jgi:hypothetical protein
MNTRRYPRTLQEAFGPYTSREVLPMREPDAWGRHGMGALLVILLVALVVIVATGKP